MIPFFSPKTTDAPSVNTAAWELKTLIFWLVLVAEHKSLMGRFCLLSCVEILCELITLCFFFVSLSGIWDFECLYFLCQLLK